MSLFFLELLFGIFLSHLEYLNDFISISICAYVTLGFAWLVVTFIDTKPKIVKNIFSVNTLNPACLLSLCRASSIGRAVDS